MTESLYMQYKRVNIEYPSDRDNPILSEVVSYTHTDDSTGTSDITDSTKLDTNKVYRLHEVTVKARSRFTSERNGYVALDFLVHVPKELLSENWRMTLTPGLLLEDTVLPLRDVVLSSQTFRDFQRQGYQNYEDYEQSIIAPEAYDDAFLDHPGIAQGIRRRQELFLDLYRREWKKRVGYMKWRNRIEGRYRHFNLQKDINRMTLYHHYMRRAELEKLQMRLVGADTTGITATYTHKFDKRARLLPQYHTQRELSDKSIPAKYRLLHATYGQWEALENNALSEKDSVEISEHRYRYDGIAENELKKALLEQTFNELIPYPYREPQTMEADTLFTPGEDFQYLYRYAYPITTGIKRLRLVLNSRAEAIDKSTYTFPASDTLAYIISSMDQLMDTTLIVKKSKVFRNLRYNMSLYPKYAPNRTEFDVKYEDNRLQVDSLVKVWRLFANERGYSIDQVTLTATASLDGNYTANERLSQRRVAAFKDYLKTHYGREMDVEPTFRTQATGEDWVTAYKLIGEHPRLPGIKALFQSLDSVNDPDRLETELRQQYKSEYKILREEVYPLLRRIDVSFGMHRPGMDVTDSIHSEYRHDYAEALKLMENKQYNEAFATLRNYGDYNTALCLVNMGQRNAALRLLALLEQNANVQYLTAIVLCQQGKRKEAAEMLMKACTTDPDKILRISQDTDVKSLVNEFNLQPKLDELENGY